MIESSAYRNFFQDFRYINIISEPYDLTHSSNQNFIAYPQTQLFIQIF